MAHLGCFVRAGGPSDVLPHKDWWPRPWYMATRGLTTSPPSPTPCTSPLRAYILRCTPTGYRRRRISPISPLGEAITCRRPLVRSRYLCGCLLATSSRGRQRIGLTKRTRPAAISRGRCECAHWWAYGTPPPSPRGAAGGEFTLRSAVREAYKLSEAYPP